MNYRRLYQDMSEGYRLRLEQIRRGSTTRVAFRGTMKGKGFKAWLEENGIPRRKAYRLIRKYRVIEFLVKQVQRDHDELFFEIFKPEVHAKVVAGFERMALLEQAQALGGQSAGLGELGAEDEACAEYERRAGRDLAQSSLFDRG